MRGTNRKGQRLHTRTICIVASVLFAALPLAQPGAVQVAEHTCHQQLQALGSALEFYLRRYRKLPERLGQLHEVDYVSDLNVFSCSPGKLIERAADIDRLGDFEVAKAFADKGATRLLWQKQAAPGGRRLAFFSDRSIRNFDGSALGTTPPKPPDHPTPPPKPPTWTADASIWCKAGDVCREKKTGLPLRILPRAFSNIYSSTQNGKVAVANVPTFHPLYVFGIEGVDASKQKGWYQVGQAVRDKPIGWMKAKDVLEWRQALIVAYTHHGTGEEARQRVLMFEDLAQLKEIAEAPDAAPRALELYERLRNKEEAPPQGIVSKETEDFVDITQRFYMMPMVGSKTVDLGGEEAKYLQIAAAVLGARGEDNLKDKVVRDKLIKKPVLEKERKKVLGLDVVFVMDMTASMQPFMDRTKEALKNLAQSFADTYKDNPELREKIRFGLVGYRDNVKLMPALEFTSRNFTPALVSAEGLAGVLESDAAATIAGSHDHPEEVFAGVNAALEGTQWRENTLKIMIIVGDASSHEGEDKQKTTDLDALALRKLAGDRQIHIMAIHLRDPRYKDDHPIAARQFEVLTRIEGDEQGPPALVGVDISKEGAFTEQVEPLTQVVAGLLNAARKGEPTGGSTTGSNGAGGPPREPASVQAFKKLFNAALVEYLGKEASPPKDIVAWVSDRDLTNPGVRSLEVRLLVNREQLNDLVVALGTLIKAMNNAEITQRGFFAALQAVAAQAEKDPERIAKAQKLREAGLVPAFVESLPYKSEILELTEEEFGQKTATEKSDLEQRLKAKLQQYREVNEQVDGWVKLNEQDERTKMVYPLELDALP